jgi:hypothetical protein
VGVTATALVTITTNPNSTYPETHFEFLMPLDNSTGPNIALMEVCRARIVSVGANMPCVTKTWINGEVTYKAKYVCLV